MLFYKYFLPLFAVIVLANCSPGSVRLKNVHRQTKILAAETSNLLQDEKYYEAIEIIRILKKLHPGDPMVDKMYDFIPAEIRKEQESRNVILGSNVANRKRVKKSIPRKILYYIPDRLTDLFDIFSLEINMGPQVGFEVWATRGIQASAYMGMAQGAGWVGKKQFGIQSSQILNFSVGPVGLYRNYTDQSGSAGDKNSYDVFYSHLPSRSMFQEYQDYWSVGFRVGILMIGLRFEIHPFEMFDFAAGILGFDPGNDDRAKTELNDFTYEQSQHLQTMQWMIFQMGKKGLIDFHKKYPTISQEGPIEDYDGNPDRKNNAPVY